MASKTGNRQIMRVFPKGQGFTIGLLGALAIAWYWPEGGEPDGPLKPELTTTAAVALIFLLQGLNLPLGQLRQGLGDWRLHLFIQIFSFVLFPLATLGLVVSGMISALWAPGFLFLAILPTTISTAIVYTSASGGDSVAATFNATLSNLLGILAVPLWCAFFVFPMESIAMAETSSDSFFSEFLAKLLGLIVTPLCVGLGFRRILGNENSARHKRSIRNLSYGCVLFIAYAGFCQGFLGSGKDSGAIWWEALVWAAILLAWAKCFTWGLGGLLGFERIRRLPAFFCASQKSLAVGLPMGQLLFGLEHPRLFFLLLPLILYHMLQLLVGAILLGHWQDSESPTFLSKDSL
jgi:sodium/bile acid cotransporter 7